MKRHVLLIAALLASVCCSKEPNGSNPSQNEAVFEVDQTAVDAEAGGGEFFRSITSNGNWTATVANGVDWITVDPASSEGTAKRKKSLIITIAANDLTEVREGSVIVSQDKLTASIVIKQAAEEKVEPTPSDAPVYAKYDDSKPVFVGWNFFELKDDSGNQIYNHDNAPTLRGSVWDYSWSAQAKTPAPTDSGFNCINNKVYPTAANHPSPLLAYLSVCDYGAQHVPIAGGIIKADGSVDGNAGLSFNLSIQVQMLKADDFLFVAIPVSSLKAGNKVTFETSIGGAAKAAGFFVIEYTTAFEPSNPSSSEWRTAEGGLTYNASTMTKWYEGKGTSTLEGAQNAVFHVFNTYKNQRSASSGGTRYVYSKDTSVDDGYFKYTFPLTGIPDVTNGTLFLRLRSFYGMRANEDNKATDGGWTDFKFVEVTIE